MHRFFTLSPQFVKEHPLVGLVLQLLSNALTDPQQNRRKTFLHVLRNLLMKHSLDDRYSIRVRAPNLLLRTLHLLFFEL